MSAYNRLDEILKSLIACTALATSMTATAAPPSNCPTAGFVLSTSKISSLEGGFGGQLDYADSFGTSLANLGDVDGDGIADLAVGAYHDDDGASLNGAIYILFMNTDGTVKAEQKISATQGGLQAPLNGYEWMGAGVASLGDLDNDGVPDVAVGIPHFNYSSNDGVGAVWILFLNADGTVKAEREISADTGGFNPLADDRFGATLTNLGDLDGDGVVDLAVGAPYTPAGGSGRGAVWILFLNTDGTVKANQKISAVDGGFGGPLSNEDGFGHGVGTVGDLDGDGLNELMVGAPGIDDGQPDAGAVWTLFLNSNGTVRSQQKISATEGGFGGSLLPRDAFGIDTEPVGDLDGDSIPDIAVGAYAGDQNREGAFWILFLNIDGTVHAYRRIPSAGSGFSGDLDDGDEFGKSLANLGDLDSDGHLNLAVGAWHDDDGGTYHGAVWMLNLDGCLAPSSTIVFNAHPASVLLPMGGMLTTFSVDAIGDGALTYEWRRDDIPLADNAHISGSAEAELTIYAGFSDIGLYHCVVTDANGQASSLPAVLGIRTTCPGDTNGDGYVNFRDIDPFIDLMNTACP